MRWFGADETTIGVPGAYCTIGEIELTPEPISSPLIVPVIEDPGSIDDEPWQLD